MMRCKSQYTTSYQTNSKNPLPFPISEILRVIWSFPSNPSDVQPLVSADTSGVQQTHGK